MPTGNRVSIRDNNETTLAFLLAEVAVEKRESSTTGD